MQRQSPAQSLQSGGAAGSTQTLSGLNPESFYFIFNIRITRQAWLGLTPLQVLVCKSLLCPLWSALPRDFTPAEDATATGLQSVGQVGQRCSSQI